LERRSLSLLGLPRLGSGSYIDATGNVFQAEVVDQDKGVTRPENLIIPYELQAVLRVQEENESSASTNWPSTCEQINDGKINRERMTEAEA
jgi:hypothetical protein